MATATSEIPLPEPFPLRSPNGPQMRERTVRTMTVLQNRLGNIAVRRALGRSLKPIEVARPLRKAFADLGATYVKFGQMVASSPAVFGRDVADEFRSLLDAGRPVSPDRVRKEIQRATGMPARELFAEFDDQPIGRASMAVVHRAVLLDGREVAVKVLRPGIERTVACDLAIMQYVLPLVGQRVEGMQEEMIPFLVDTLRQQLCEELDLRNEARIMAHFSTLLEQSNLRNIKVPHPYPELSSRRVLFMEYLDGVAIDDMATVESFGVDPGPLVIDIVKSFFLTATRFGIFHGDIHAGNLLLLRDGRVGVLDWGIVGRLDEDNRERFRTIIRAGLGDADAWDLVAQQIIDELGPDLAARFGLTAEQVAPLVRSMLEPLFNKPFGQFSLSTLLIGPEELAGKLNIDPSAAKPNDIHIDPERFDRSMMLLAKQLVYFERYGQLYLQDTPLLDDTEFFRALVDPNP